MKKSILELSRPSGYRSEISLIYDREGSRKYLTVQERNAFLAATKKVSREVRTFCLVLAYTGARISEVLNLTSSRIDFEAQVVVFETLKKRRRGVFRAVPVPAELLAELDRAHAVRMNSQDPHHSKQDVWPWCRTTAWGHVKDCMAAANIAGPQATPKGLRHAFAVAALQSGVPLNLVQRWLGHARISTTAIYANVIGDEERIIAQKLWKEF